MVFGFSYIFTHFVQANRKKNQPDFAASPGFYTWNSYIVTFMSIFQRIAVSVVPDSSHPHKKSENQLKCKLQGEFFIDIP